MAIEKWRPAKAGDSGKIARFRDADDGHWRIGKLKRIYSDDVGRCKWLHFFNGVEWFLHCEVLEAYLSDEEVEALADGVAAGIKTFKDLCADAIRKHFASEKGGE